MLLWDYTIHVHVYDLTMAQNYVEAYGLMGYPKQVNLLGFWNSTESLRSIEGATNFGLQLSHATLKDVCGKIFYNTDFFQTFATVR